jgi:hypothetical protein
MTHKHDGQWLIGGRRKVIYGATRLPFAERVKAAEALVEQEHRRAARAARAAARKAGTRP